MASRSGGGSGVFVTIALLGVVSLALFVLLMVYISKYQTADRTLRTTQAEQAEFVRPDERNSDQVQRLKEVARSENRSLVGYLTESLRTIATRVGGTAADTPTQLLSRMDQISTTGSLSDVIRDLQGQLRLTGEKLAQADRDRQSALESLKAETERTQALTQAHQRTIEAMNADLSRYRADVDGFRQGVNTTKAEFDRSLEAARAELATTEARLGERIRRLEGENLQLIDRLSKLQAEKSRDILRPASEESLVDGSVIAIDPATSTVTIDRGRRDKVFLGMTFAVYADATQIKPDPRTGEYPRGKATIEIIRVDETSSAARVTSEVRGNPIVRGDVIANALYDPNKVYTFLVYGTFDANRDGRSTAAEADQIRALIEGWGGRVAEDLSGNVDFVVLGSRPQIPPRPGPGAPIEVVREFIRLDQAAQRYDQLFQQAAATSIPVLNENRLFTLIGKR